MNQPEIKIKSIPLSKIKPYENNAKMHPGWQIEQIAASMNEFGNCDPIALWENEEGEFEVVEGHGRLMALQSLGVEKAPCFFLNHLSDEQRRAYTHVHNKQTMNTDLDFTILDEELANLNFDWEELGFEELVIDTDVESYDGTLAERFLAPPFTVLDSRQGYWIDRKRHWKEKIGDTGQARDGAEVYGGLQAGYLPKFDTAISVLDPVLAEIMNLFFMPTGGGKSFDPFAGDTAFGFVSASMGNKFTGIELRQEQVDFNTAAVKHYKLPAKYICDDGRNVAHHIKPESQDLLFSCPPYYDVEVYSDKPDDASNQETFDDFYAILDEAFGNAIGCLKNNRFAVIVYGNVRDKKGGTYYPFREKLVETFTSRGMGLYNELILVTPVGTAAYRANRSMKNRKMVSTHQSVLVFHKGKQESIASDFGVVDIREDECVSEDA